MSDSASGRNGVNCEPLKKLIREVPDFPGEGHSFL